MKHFSARTILVFFVLLLLSGSCMAPASGDRYLERFEQFVTKVENNGLEYKETDWKWANRQYSRYAGEWYDQFRDVLSAEEKVRVLALRGRYFAAKANSRTGRLIDENLREDLKNLRKGVKKYLDENLDQDLEEVQNGIQEIGDSTRKVVEEVLEEIKKKKE